MWHACARSVILCSGTLVGKFEEAVGEVVVRQPLVAVTVVHVVVVHGGGRLCRVPLARRHQYLEYACVELRRNPVGALSHAHHEIPKGLEDLEDEWVGPQRLSRAHGLFRIELQVALLPEGKLLQVVLIFHRRHDHSMP